MTFTRGQSGRDVKLTIHNQLVLKPRNYGFIHPLLHTHLWRTSASYGRKVPFRKCRELHVSSRPCNGVLSVCSAIGHCCTKRNQFLGLGYHNWGICICLKLWTRPATPSPSHLPRCSTPTLKISIQHTTLNQPTAPGRYTFLPSSSK